MGSMEWPRTDYPEPQPPRRLGWLEAAGWITCIDPVLTLPTQAEDFTKRRQAHEIIEVAADYSRRSTAWAPSPSGRRGELHEPLRTMKPTSQTIRLKSLVTSNLPVHVTACLRALPISCGGCCIRSS